MFNFLKRILGVSFVGTMPASEVSDFGAKVFPSVDLAKAEELHPLEFIPAAEDYVEKEKGLFAKAGLDEIPVGYERKLPPLDIVAEANEVGNTVISAFKVDDLLLKRGVEVLGRQKPDVVAEDTFLNSGFARARAERQDRSVEASKVGAKVVASGAVSALAAEKVDMEKYAKYMPPADYWDTRTKVSGGETSRASAPFVSDEIVPQDGLGVPLYKEKIVSRNELVGRSGFKTRTSGRIYGMRYVFGRDEEGNIADKSMGEKAQGVGSETDKVKKGGSGLAKIATVEASVTLPINPVVYKGAGLIPPAGSAVPALPKGSDMPALLCEPEALSPKTAYAEVPHGKMTAKEFEAKVADCAKDFYIDEEGELKAKNVAKAPVLSVETERLIREYRTHLLWKIYNAVAVGKNSYPELNRAFLDLGYKGPSELRNAGALVHKELAYVAENVELIGRVKDMSAYDIPNLAKDFRLDITGKLKSEEGELEETLPADVMKEIKAYRLARIAKVHNAVNVLHKLDIRVVRPLMNLGYKGTSAVKNGAADLKEEMRYYTLLCVGQAVMACKQQER